MYIFNSIFEKRGVISYFLSFHGSLLIPNGSRFSNITLCLNLEFVSPSLLATIILHYLSLAHVPLQDHFLYFNLNLYLTNSSEAFIIRRYRGSEMDAVIPLPTDIIINMAIDKEVTTSDLLIRSILRSLIFCTLSVTCNYTY